MSRLSLKLLIVSILLTLATTSNAFAQMSQMRLFSPYPDDEFGGGAYMHEGFYGSVGAGIVFITQPPDQLIGNTKGGSELSVTNTIGGANETSVFTAVPTASQMNTSNMGGKWVTATDFEVGNMRGHHGWSVKGTVVSPMKNTVKGLDAGINIYDPAIVEIQQWGTNGNYYLWNRGTVPLLTQLDQGTLVKVGRLWGIVGLYGSQTTGNSYSGGGSASSSTSTEDEKYAFVAIPLTFNQWQVSTKCDTFSVEAMYTYRFHPFRRGTLEFLAGVRYTAFKESMDFAGMASTKLTTEYSDTRVEILQTGTQSSTGGQAVTSTSQSFVNNQQNQSYELGADLGISSWKFRVDNQLVGPQIGLRYILTNNRWQFLGETKFFAALNRQNLYGSGILGLKASSSQTTNLTQTNGTPLYAPVNTVQNYFTYSSHFNQFSPGVDTKFQANWNWTQCVSFGVSYQMLFLSNLARAAAINDYRMNEDGTIFGVKQNKSDRNFDTFVHGVMFNVNVNK